MNVFKRKSIYLAVAAGLGAVGMTSPASAVNVNVNNVGQVLIYPYYTTRGGTDTYVSIVNTTATYKAVKVRFTEGKNSREVLDFNLYLSPQDVFTGAVVNTTDGAKFITADKSCTNPPIPSTGANFVNYAYAGTLVEGIVDKGGDGESATLDRTREGYFEVIEMGTITNTAIQAAIKHNSAGVPANCAVVQVPKATMDMTIGTLTLYPLVTGTATAIAAPTGGLAGTASLMNVAAGTDMAYEPVALSDFNNVGIWYDAGDIRPDMRNAAPSVSRVFKGGTVVQTDWTGSVANAPVNAVSAVLMHDNLMNEFVLDTATASGTDWIITMPTKRYYVPVNDNIVNATDALPLATVGTQLPIPPFTKTFYTGGACEPMSVVYYDREEQTTSTPGGFSPPAPGPAGTSLCWETTVMTFNNSNVLASANSVNYPVNPQNGWAKLTFAQTYASAAAGFPGSLPAVLHTYVGLPTVGMMVQTFKNGNVGGVLSNYGGNFNHKFTTSITAVGGPAVGAE